MLYINNTTNY